MSKRRQLRSERLSIVSLGELMSIREKLEEVTKPGTDPVQQAAVVTWAMQYADSYYYTRNRSLRRVFPKDKGVVIFSGSRGGGKTAAMGGTNAAGKS